MEQQRTEFTAKAVCHWSTHTAVQTPYIELGSLWKNGYNESLNGKLRDELLEGEIFHTLKEAQVMTDVHTLLSDIRVALEKVEQKIRRHPYVVAIEEGKIEKETLKVFAGEQYHIISSDIRSVALLVSRWGHGTSVDFFWMLLQGEVEALKALLRFASALGVSEEGLKAYDPFAGAQAYKAYMAWLSLYGSDAEAAAAFLVNFPAWGANCGRMSEALKKNYGFKADEVAFFDLFSTPAADFEQKAVTVIDKGLSRGVAPVAIKTAARLLQDYELLFWDTLYPRS